jgi:hypothetical protein
MPAVAPAATTRIAITITATGGRPTLLRWITLSTSAERNAEDLPADVPDDLYR